MLSNRLNIDFFSLKWLILPVGVLLYALLNMESGKSDCQSACLVEGYEHIRYQPKYRSKFNTTPESCTCLTEQESQLKTRIPKGVKLY